MHVSCPNCAATYQVPDARLKPGRRLRCAQCSVEWTPVEVEPFTEALLLAAVEVQPAAPQVERSQKATAPEAVPDSPAIPLTPAANTTSPEPSRTAPALQSPAIVERPMRLVPPEHVSAMSRARASVPLLLAWVLTLIVLAASGWGAYQYRSVVMQFWPPSERAYAALGLN
jgi:predicted Zn finger-like uncharacterized protein